ncbi:MAG: dockerin type I domain-containing protein, partial [Isosphaeraceae bacterium]
IDVAAAPDSQVKTLISSVDDPQGNTVPQTFRSVYDPTLPRKSVALGAATSAVITPVTYRHRNPVETYEYSVNVEGVEKSTGRFIVGFYLPGDANGDGAVDQADVKAVRAAMNSKAGDARYSFDADANRDGRIGRIDLAFTQQNMGSKTAISPIVSANLDAASDTGIPDRVTTVREVNFNGVASPNASITYTEVRGKTDAVTTLTDSQGNYNISVKLADGPNTFKVTTLDGFGQSITGVIAPVTFSTAASVSPVDLYKLREGINSPPSD